MLLLRSPASLRFEALTSFGVPVVLVAGDAQSVTLWEVLDNRAFILPASPDATRRWLGLGRSDPRTWSRSSRGASGRSRTRRRWTCCPPDELGPSLKLANADGEQRIWLDPDTGQARQVEWTGGKNPARVTYDATPPDGPPAGLKLATLDGKLEVVARYRDPAMNTGFDPTLLDANCPGTCDESRTSVDTSRRAAW